MTTWILSLRRERASSLVRLYEIEGVEVAELGDVVWARSAGPREDASRLLSLVPAARFYELVGNDRLTPLGRLVPTRRLPPLTWSPLNDWLELRVPRSSLPGEIDGNVEICLVRSPAHESPTGEEMLLGSLRDLRAFAASAPLHRLRLLRFALSDAGEVLLRGTVATRRIGASMPGERFSLRGGVAAPVGMSWSPSLAPGVIREWLGLKGGDIVVLRRDGTLAQIAQDAFAPLRRSVLRELDAEAS